MSVKFIKPLQTFSNWPDTPPNHTKLRRGANRKYQLFHCTRDSLSCNTREQQCPVQLSEKTLPLWRVGFSVFSSGINFYFLFVIHVYSCFSVYLRSITVAFALLLFFACCHCYSVHVPYGQKYWQGINIGELPLNYQ